MSNLQSERFRRVNIPMRVFIPHTWNGFCNGIKSGANIAVVIPTDPLWTYDIVKSFMCMREASLLSGMTRSTGNTEYDKRHDREGTLNGRRFRGEDFLLYGPTCNLAITRKVAESILFVESYPDAACEDVDYCMKALLNGFKICHAPTMNVAHDYGYDGFSCPPEQKCHERLNRYAEGQKILQKIHPNYWKCYEMTEEMPCPTQDE